MNLSFVPGFVAGTCLSSGDGFAAKANLLTEDGFVIRKN